jgi:hypothetical protein
MFAKNGKKIKFSSKKWCFQFIKKDPPNQIEPCNTSLNTSSTTPSKRKFKKSPAVRKK